MAKADEALAKERLIASLRTMSVDQLQSLWIETFPARPAACEVRESYEQRALIDAEVKRR